ncbi:hypothetical protein [Rivularia sp. UHCC 0363]|uniref:hypothetical protein n=1 Tax=Rivularia sp. UHCC 0363 TaxID=3110244 RepID=UPI002B21DEBF|nr:hypothetical protein [Rivularia sp. UHCC 0363]MEA5598878.1 hypothetical protein [Rivularia sp. UHCC 0363]
MLIITKNQQVQLRIDACPYLDYGIKGIVNLVSRDAIANNTSVNEKFFKVIIQSDQTFGNYSRKCNLQIGMNATAQIISKQETAINYLLRKARLATDLLAEL